MNILKRIVKHKEKEVAERKSLYPTKLLEQSIFFPTTTVSLKKYIVKEDKSGIIAEIKRQSPSRGIINPDVAVERTSIGYMQAGASALSVLTDSAFFGGSAADLTLARKYNFCPILRKDFIIDEYQIVEAKSIGADAVLLIASILDPAQLKSLATFARSLQLEVLLEVHNEIELNAHIDAMPDLVGVNNRNLDTFDVDIAISKNLVEHIPKGITKISESGIDSPETAIDLRNCGYDGFLIGELFMKSSRPEKAALEFIREMKRLKNKSKSDVVH